jgi:stage II sporulation protein E
MEKVERPMMEPLGDVQLKEAKAGAINWIQQLQMKSEDIFIKKGISLAIIGFLLGRALILSQLAPFGLPFFAAVFLMRRDRAPLALFGLIAGGLTVHYSNSLVIFASAFLLLLFHKIKKPAVEGQFKTMSMYVFASLFLVNLAEQYLVFRTIQLYDLMMIGVEAGLAMILTLIFIQSIPLLTVRTKTQSLKTEEIVSIIILLASVMTGTIGWMIYDLSLDHIFSRYLVLLFGLAGGAAIGSTVGVVTGLIFSLASIASLYQMSLLAFSGLLGGLLKGEGR